MSITDAEFRAMAEAVAKCLPPPSGKIATPAILIERVMRDAITPEPSRRSDGSLITPYAPDGGPI